MLVGPSRYGKTAFARSLGRHVYLNTRWNARLLSGANESDVRYIVVDDIDRTAILSDGFGGSDGLPSRGNSVIRQPWRSLLGGQSDINVTDKYVKTIVLRGAMPLIYLANEANDFTDSLSNSELDYFDKNVVRVNVTQPLFVQ